MQLITEVVDQAETNFVGPNRLWTNVGIMWRVNGTVSSWKIGLEPKSLFNWKLHIRLVNRMYSPLSSFIFGWLAWKLLQMKNCYGSTSHMPILYSVLIQARINLAPIQVISRTNLSLIALALKYTLEFIHSWMSSTGQSNSARDIPSLKFNATSDSCHSKLK